MMHYLLYAFVNKRAAFRRADSLFCATSLTNENACLTASESIPRLVLFSAGFLTAGGEGGSSSHVLTIQGEEQNTKKTKVKTKLTGTVSTLVQSRLGTLHRKAPSCSQILMLLILVSASDDVISNEAPLLISMGVFVSHDIYVRQRRKTQTEKRIAPQK